MNTIYLEGRLVKEPDIIWTESGICIANHRCVAFGPEAEKIGNDSQKGRIYKIKGSMIPNNYVNKEGKKIYGFKFKAEFIEFGALPKRKTETKPKEQAA